MASDQLYFLVEAQDRLAQLKKLIIADKIRLGESEELLRQWQATIKPTHHQLGVDTAVFLDGKIRPLKSTPELLVKAAEILRRWEAVPLPVGWASDHALDSDTNVFLSMLPQWVRLKGETDDDAKPGRPEADTGDPAGTDGPG